MVLLGHIAHSHHLVEIPELIKYHQNSLLRCYIGHEKNPTGLTILSKHITSMWRRSLNILGSDLQQIAAYGS